MISSTMIPKLPTFWVECCPVGIKGRGAVNDLLHDDTKATHLLGRVLPGRNQREGLG